MSDFTARFLLILFTVGMYCWSFVVVPYFDLGLGNTVSVRMYRTFTDNPASAVLFGALVFSIVRDAFPEVGWGWLLLTGFIFVGIGHFSWPLTLK